MGHFAPASLAQRSPRQRTWRGSFLPDDAELHYHRLAAQVARSLPGDDPRLRELPSDYTEGYPLDAESKPSGVTGSTGYPTRLFKAVSLRDGVARAVRRVDGVRLPLDVLRAVLSRWGSPAHGVASHPSIIALRECPSPSPGDRATFFAHDLVPGARSLADIFFSERPGEAPQLGEELVWRVAADALLGIRAAHAAGLSLHGITLERLLLAPDGRCLIAGAGVLEALDHESDRPLPALQENDVSNLGAALLQLAVRDTAAAQPGSLQASLRALSAKATPQLTRLVGALMARPPPSAAAAVDELLAPRLPALYEGILRRCEALDSLVAAEAGSGRMLRLLVKLLHVLDRPEADVDPAWGSGGDKLVLAAMRDAIFHQTDESGRPRMDPSHVMECLQRLDMGDPQRVLLPARDGQTLLMADWATLRASVHDSFGALAKAADGPVPPIYGGLRPGTQAAMGRRLGVAGALPVEALAPAGFHQAGAGQDPAGSAAAAALRPPLLLLLRPLLLAATICKCTRACTAACRALRWAWAGTRQGSAAGTAE
ncbi:hypothetical protein FNF31_01196 [Cafeteria roenbergensis]|uniref:Pan3 C-terminal knob domain-containing protein n=1 Tax=Cafeteria roenbergensis TaxID=33653 RepID=A0A5A8DSQ5_CAFRO|nr:hypothetical protein FNF31_01196 [Cafeteria roenbergensis]